MSRKVVRKYTAARVGIGAGAALAVGAATITLLGWRRLHHAGHAGRVASSATPPTELPLTTKTRHGRAGDPINMQLVATATQVGAAFASASWYRADELDLVTSVRISIDFVLGRKYSTAPVSNLYLYGRSEDLAFERPGESVRERDHIRLWQTARTGADGRPVWIGGATRDIRVELAKTNHLPTHQIGPDIDGERGLVVADLEQTGFVQGTTWRPGFGASTRGTNGGGDPWFTDGRVAVLTLADVWVPSLAAHAHGRLGVRLAQLALRLSRLALPRITWLKLRSRASMGGGNTTPTVPGV